MYRGCGSTLDFAVAHEALVDLPIWVYLHSITKTSTNIQVSTH